MTFLLPGNFFRSLAAVNLCHDYANMLNLSSLFEGQAFKLSCIYPLVIITTFLSDFFQRTLLFFRLKKKSYHFKSNTSWYIMLQFSFVFHCLLTIPMIFMFLTRAMLWKIQARAGYPTKVRITMFKVKTKFRNQCTPGERGIMSILDSRRGILCATGQILYQLNTSSASNNKHVSGEW